MSNGNGKTYNDPAKQLARTKLKEFIAKHFSEKRRREIKVLCFPGAEADGEEALEVKEVYDPLGIQRQNITGLESDKTRVDRLRRANLGIKVVPQLDWEFFQTASEKFDVISLDYTSYFADAQRYSLDLIASRKLFNDNGVLATNYYGAREKVDEAFNLSYLNRLSSAGVSLEDFALNPSGSIKRLLSQSTEIKDVRSDGIMSGVAGALMNGKLALNPFALKILTKDPEQLKRTIKKLADMSEEVVSEGEILGRDKYERLARSSFFRCVSMGDFMNCFRKRFGWDLDSAIHLYFHVIKPYGVLEHESYSYISNKSSPMFMDLWYIVDTESVMRRDFYRFPKPGKIEILPGITGKKREKLMEKAKAFIKRIFPDKSSDQNSIVHKERIFLGSSSQLGKLAEEPESPKQTPVVETQEQLSVVQYQDQAQTPSDKPALTREQAIELIKQGKSTSEIADAYSGLTKRELGALKAWHAPENQDNGLRKQKTRNNEYPPELVGIVRDELETRRKNTNYRLTTNHDLAEVFECSSGLVARCLKTSLSSEERAYRRRAILSQTASETIRNGRGIARQTTEQRRVIGTNNYNNGKGIGALTEEERRQIGTDNYNNGKGIGSLTGEQRREIGTRNAEKRMTVFWKGNYYHSASEAAIGDLFTQYFLGFSIDKGKTWQVNGNGMKLGAVDFLLNGNFVEYHPPRACYTKKNGGDLRSPEEYRKFKTIKKRIGDKHGKDKEKIFQRRVESLIRHKYKESRRSAIENSGYKGTPFIYCASAQEVYDKVVAPYSPQIHSYKQFKRQFNSLLRQIKQANSGGENGMSS